MIALVCFLAATLAGLGVGSGGFLLLYLTDALGYPQYTAQGINLVFFAAATLASSLMSYRAGRLSLSRLLPLLVFGALGSVGGSLLTLAVPPAAARRAFGLFLLLGGGYTLFVRILRLRDGKTKKSRAASRKSLDKSEAGVYNKEE